MCKQNTQAMMIASLQTLIVCSDQYYQRQHNIPGFVTSSTSSCSSEQSSSACGCSSTVTTDDLCLRRTGSKTTLGAQLSTSLSDSVFSISPLELNNNKYYNNNVSFCKRPCIRVGKPAQRRWKCKILFWSN